MNYFVHELADVRSDCIGENTNIWQYVVILPGACIGRDANICANCLIENDVILGDRVTVKSGVQLWDGLRVGDDVFIGPNATFANDKYPRSKVMRRDASLTVIESGASIGAGAIILPGVHVGRNAMVGAGAVVTRSVPANAIVTGNPGRISGYVDTPTRDSHDFSSSASISAHTQLHLEAKYRLIKFPVIKDIRGSLTVGDFSGSVPFETKRFFTVYDVPNQETRGEHAHRECHQLLICMRGSLRAVADDGQYREEFVLDAPNIGLHLPPKVWGIQYKYSPDAVLLVFASHLYDPTDYIRDYSEFAMLTKENG